LNTYHCKDYTWVKWPISKFCATVMTVLLELKKKVEWSFNARCSCYVS